MPVERITANQFATQITDAIAARDVTLDTRVDAIRDLQIDPYTGVLENQNERVVYLNKLLSLKNASNLVPDDVDDRVYDEGMVRWSGSRALVTLTFSRSRTPTSDIVVPLSFPVSTKTDPRSGGSVLFRTIETKTMYAASAESYKNATTGKYEINVAAAAVAKGSSTKVGAYTVTDMRRPLDQFDSVTNIAASNSGKGVETNEELATRYLLSIEGSQIGTPAGLKKFIVDNISTVEDAYIVYGDSSYLTREDIDTGAVDAWVLGNIPSPKTYITRYAGTYTLNVVDFQPLYRVTSVSSVTTGDAYLEGTDFTVETGVGEWSYSNQAQDGIRWIPGGNHPAVGDDLVIVYEYNSLINILSSFFNQPNFKSMGVDKLFRWAQPSQLELDCNLKVRSGSSTEVMNAVRNAVMAFINAKKLGENVEEFDIDSVVSRIYGVDNWTYNQLSIKDGTGVQDLTIAPNAYARMEDADFVINLV
jgi:hypothetical protein